jgi:hypothetical protein
MAGNLGTAAAGRVLGANTTLRALGVLDEAAWTAKYAAWKLNPIKGEFGTIPRDLKVGGLCREVAGMTPGGILGSARTEAAARAGEAGGLEVLTEGAVTAIGSVTSALAAIRINAKGRAHNPKGQFMSLKGFKEGASALGTSLKTASKSTTQKATRLLEGAVQRVHDTVDVAAEIVEVALADLNGTADELEHAADAAYGAYIRLANQERDLRLQIRGIPAGAAGGRTGLEAQAEQLKGQVIELRARAKVASAAASRMHRIAGYAAYKHRGGSTRRSGGRKARRSTRSRK